MQKPAVKPNKNTSALTPSDLEELDRASPAELDDPPGTATHGSEILTAHIEQCEKHPARKWKTQRDAAMTLLSEAETVLQGLIAEVERFTEANKALEQERDAARRLAQENAEHALDIARERDAARAELARLTTPRPIAEAPKDGAWIGAIWEDMDAEDCQRYGPIAVVKWRGTGWEDSDGDGYEPPSHFLPLPVLP